ncbi:MAG: M48 family metallopeptidase [Woeseiaceae bacterium]|nr:M48 family metallopeptidase [Woeseiaceae bacterium]
MTAKTGRFVVALLLLATAGCAVNPVTGERELTLVGTAEEIRMGEESYLPMRQSQGGEYDVDPELTAYVQDVGQRLAAVSDRPLPYEFVVLNNSVPNAWALPGGKIAINRGLLTELGSEAELAAVLGHEIVHAAARHSARRMEQGMLLQGLVLATAVVTSDSDYGNLAIGGASVGAQLLTQRYSRSAELEADRYGMQYMAAAGYDPQGAVSLQETFLRLSEGRRSDWLSGLFASHPPSQARLEANRQTAASLAPGVTWASIATNRCSPKRARRCLLTRRTTRAGRHSPTGTSGWHCKKPKKRSSASRGKRISTRCAVTPGCWTTNPTWQS